MVVRAISPHFWPLESPCFIAWSRWNFSKHTTCAFFLPSTNLLTTQVPARHIYSTSNPFSFLPLTRLRHGSFEGKGIFRSFSTLTRRFQHTNGGQRWANSPRSSISVKATDPRRTSRQRPLAALGRGVFRQVSPIPSNSQDHRCSDSVADLTFQWGPLLRSINLLLAPDLAMLAPSAHPLDLSPHTPTHPW